MSRLSIRSAVLEDALKISVLIQRAIRETNASDYSPAVIDLTCANFTSERVVQKMAVRDVFVATIDTVIVGTVSFGGDKLHSLFVDSRHQHQGIGSRLVRHVEAHAVARGLNVLRLSSSIAASLLRTHWLRVDSVRSAK